MKYRTEQSGFTIVELLVSIGIFTLITGVVLARYRTFDTNAKFVNASEDIVLALRQAQVYGVGVRGTTGALFDVPYGVHFDTTTPNQIRIFADSNRDGKYIMTDDSLVETVQWDTSIGISNLVCGSSACTSFLDVTFKRPNVDAIIDDSVGPGYMSSAVTIASGAKTSTVFISRAGQISLQ